MLYVSISGCLAPSSRLLTVLFGSCEGCGAPIPNPLAGGATGCGWLNEFGGKFETGFVKGLGAAWAGAFPPTLPAKGFVLFENDWDWAGAPKGFFSGADVPKGFAAGVGLWANGCGKELAWTGCVEAPNGIEVAGAGIPKPFDCAGCEGAPKGVASICFCPKGLGLPAKAENGAAAAVEEAAPKGLGFWPKVDGCPKAPPVPSCAGVPNAGFPPNALGA